MPCINSHSKLQPLLLGELLKNARNKKGECQITTLPFDLLNYDQGAGANRK